MTKQKSLLERTWYNWLINCIPKGIALVNKLRFLLKQTHTQKVKNVEKKNERKREFVEHQLQTISYIRNLLGELRHVPVRTSECFDGTQIKYDSYGDIYFEILSTEKYLEEMKTQFIEELKSTRSSWKIKPVVGVIFEYDNDDKKIEMEIFIRSINEKKKKMVKTDSDVSINDIIKSFTKAYNGID